MVINKEKNITIVFQENTDLVTFIDNFKGSYGKIKHDHIIINLFSFDDLGVSDLLEFLEISDRHRNAKKSFVLVTKKVNFDDIPESLCVAPTLQEAKDIVEMEEIERDLGI